MAFAKLLSNRSEEDYFFNVALVGDPSVSEVSGDSGSGSLTSRTSSAVASPNNLEPKSVQKNSRSLRGAIRRRLGRTNSHRRRELNSITVPAKTLNALIQETTTRRLDLLDLDVEGLEIEILRGYSFLPRPRVLCAETRGPLLAEAVRLLTDHGYALKTTFWGLPKVQARFVASGTQISFGRMPLTPTLSRRWLRHQFNSRLSTDRTPVRVIDERNQMGRLGSGISGTGLANLCEHRWVMRWKSLRRVSTADFFP